MNSARSAKKKGSNINGTAGPSACPGESPPPDLIRGWTPVRRKGHAPTNESRACPDSAGTGHALAAALAFVLYLFNSVAHVVRSHKSKRQWFSRSIRFHLPAIFGSTAFLKSRRKPTQRR